MVAYEFYCRNQINEPHLIGILPERRRNSERITNESIMNWVRKVLGYHEDIHHIFFIRVILEENEKGYF
jgi:hypothetical protein